MKHGAEFGPRIGMGEVRRGLIAKHMQPHKIDLHVYLDYVTQFEQDLLARAEGAGMPIKSDSKKIMLERVERAQDIAELHNSQEDTHAKMTLDVSKIDVEEQVINEHKNSIYVDKKLAQKQLSGLRERRRSTNTLLKNEKAALVKTNSRLYPKFRQRGHEPSIDFYTDEVSMPTPHLMRNRG